jgi:glycosyltransferase involved in cell wall biosynthesis
MAGEGVVVGSAGATPPRVSVIIPCHEHIEHLAEALESAIGQGSHVDTIVVDDGSTTDVRSVTRSFPGVRYIRQEHAGVSAARNTGLAAQDAPFVVFLDADDRLLPGAVDAGLECLGRDLRAGFAFGRYRFIRESGLPAGAPGAVVPDAPDYLSLVRQNYVGMFAAVIFRTAALDKAGAFDTDLRVSEDYELLLRVARSHPICSHDELVAEYRRYDTSASADASLMLRSVIGVLDRERASVSPDVAADSAFAEGMDFFKLFYGVRIVRLAMRDIVLGGRFSTAWSRLRELHRVVGTRLMVTRLPPAVAVAAVRKTRYIIVGHHLARREAAAARGQR